jgi:hypothetical protein
MAKLPLNIQTLYADLEQSLTVRDAPVGSPYDHEVHGRPYTYLSERQGVARIKHYLGPKDAPETLDRLRASAEAGERASQRRALVRLLKSFGLPGPTTAVGRVLEVLARNGLFDNGAVLVGTVAYQCMGALVGRTLPLHAMATQDADLATGTLALAADPSSRDGDDPEAAVEAERPSLETLLQRADPTFRGAPHLSKAAPPARFQASNGLMVEVLVPRLRRSDPTPVSIKPLRAGGLPLQQLDWLIAHPVAAVALHGAGVRVRVPQPARYAVHKLIVAQKPERNPQKRIKDLTQSSALIAALREHDPDALGDALADARKRGKRGWAEPIATSLRAIGAEEWQS